MDEKKKQLVDKTASRIRQLRMMKDFSQEELALIAGINPAYLGHIERGLKCPTIDTINKIAMALGITLSEFFAFDDMPNGNKYALSRIEAVIRNIPEETAEKVVTLVEITAELMSSPLEGS